MVPGTSIPTRTKIMPSTSIQPFTLMGKGLQPKWPRPACARPKWLTKTDQAPTGGSELLFSSHTKSFQNTFSKTVSGSQDLPRKLSPVKSILPGLGIIRTDGELVQETSLTSQVAFAQKY